MGCWGITAFESDAGLDAVGFIRRNLPEDGRLELGKVIGAMQKAKCRLPEASDGDSHTGPMALAEIMVKFLDGDLSGLDYDEDWAAADNKFSAITSFTADKESVRWLRNYISDTLQYAREDAEFRAQHGEKWCGWRNENLWLDWQEHMSALTIRLDTLLASTESRIELIRPQEQANGPIMGLNQ